MEFLADENVAPRVVEAARKQGFIIHTVSEQKLSGAPDEKIIKVARKNGWIIITHDKDFGNFLRYPVQSHAGVILLRFNNQSPHSVARYLTAFLKKMGTEKIAKKLVILREDRIKIM